MDDIGSLDLVPTEATFDSRTHWRLDERGVPDGLSPAFLERVRALDLRTVGLVVDVDGVIADDRAEIPQRNVDLLAQAGTQAQRGDLGGVVECTQRDPSEMGTAYPNEADFLGVSGAVRHYAGDDQTHVDPVWLAAQARYGEIDKELRSHEGLRDLYASRPDPEPEWQPSAPPEPRRRGRDVILPLEGADPGSYGEIAALAGGVAERHECVVGEPRDGLIRMTYPPLTARMDRGAALGDWAREREVSTLIILDDTDKGVAGMPSELQADGQRVAVMKIAVDSPGARRNPAMFEGSDLAAYLSGRDAVTDFLSRFVELVDRQAAGRQGEP